VRQIHV